MATTVAHVGVEVGIAVQLVAQVEVDLETLDEALGAGGLTGWDWATAGFADACRRHDIQIPLPQRTLWWGDDEPDPDTRYPS